MLTEERVHSRPITPPRPALPLDGLADAVVVDRVSKVFVRKPLVRLPWRRAEEPGKAKQKEVRAIDDVAFAVRRNEIFGVLGANGSGKSTLIRMMSTLLIPDRGRIRVFGLDVRRDEREVKKLINRVSVEASFFKKLSPMENLLYALRLYGRGGSSLRGEIVAILGELGVKAERVNQPLEQLSRGMQQKVAIARALLASPVLLLLDEPTTGLDPRSKKDVQGFVHRLRDEHDATIILCTHDMAEAEELCDRIAVIDKGRLVALDTVDGLKRSVGLQMGDLDPSLEDVFIYLTGRSLEDEEDEDDE